MICSHSTSWYADPSYDCLGNRIKFGPRPEPQIFCPACTDAKVDLEGQVCQSCRDSVREEWGSTESWLRCRELIAADDARNGRAA